MKPVRDFVLVKPFMAEGVTEGGLFIPENYRERSCKAKIEAKKDDVIFHIKGAGEAIILNDELHFLIRHNDILAYVSNN